MKRCAFCGGEYNDDLTVCPLDRQPLDYDTLLHPVAPGRESPRIGVALDVSAIAPRIRELREDYIAALRRRPHPVSHRAELIAMARRAIAQLHFFRHEKTADEIENPKSLKRI